jgi:hypothetical protein
MIASLPPDAKPKDLFFAGEHAAFGSNRQDRIARINTIAGLNCARRGAAAHKHARDRSAAWRSWACRLLQQ